ncbi:MAG: response regulator [Deltaproteobacteria bacterium]|nr:response regulator [Deltaproteobacteria bacterium]
MDTTSRLSILYVEDEPDIRETLAEILQLHDYEVVSVESSEAAMAELRRGGFDLLLTDYNLPGQSGGWLIEEGQQLGLLQGTAVLVVTAHPTPRMAPDVVVMRKPLDIDHFLRQVHELLEPAAEARALSKGGAPVRATPVDLVLYVSPDSPASLRALRNLHALLERFPGLPVKLTVRNLAESGAEPEGDQVAFAPTLVRRGPGPRAWILGTLDDVQPVLDLLRVEGLAPAAVG